MTITTLVSMLAEGMLTSITIFALTLLGSLPLGLLVAFGRMSKSALVRVPVRIYISIMRGTPLMLQLMFVYFAPYYIFGIPLSPNYRFIAVMIAFIINYAAYFAEIYRGGLQAISPGQYEAAAVLGYSRLQCFCKIIFPQFVKHILPPVTNEVITLVKDTSLAFVLSVSEMFTVAKAIAAAQKTMTAFIAAGVFYYVFNALVAWIMELIEKRLAYFR